VEGLIGRITLTECGDGPLVIGRRRGNYDCEIENVIAYVGDIMFARFWKASFADGGSVVRSV